MERALVQSNELARYARHLRATLEWIVASIEHGHGGSCAHFSLAGGWSAPYPETTGYLIPTLLALDSHAPDLGLAAHARDLGRWLVSIQSREGGWRAGLHPPRSGARLSVFNTGQILDGLVALHRADGGGPWLESAQRGAQWLVRGQGPDGAWRDAEHESDFNASYLAQAVWPMLEVWLETGEEATRRGAESFLASVLRRVRPNGAFERWGFGGADVAFTHTIAYTLRGILECSRILDAWDDVGSKAVPALERMLRKAELSAGRLEGAFDLDWQPRGRFECLTGSAQTAINLLIWEAREGDLRIVNGAARLIDRVCAVQGLEHLLAGLRGSVPGSTPPWGRYMLLRHPNWAAKYHCDALALVSRRIERETEALACASS